MRIINDLKTTVKSIWYTTLLAISQRLIKWNVLTVFWHMKLVLLAGMLKRKVAELDKKIFEVI